MKVLIINSVFKRGSTGRICYGIAKKIIASGGECVVCYGRNYVVDNEINTYRIGSNLGIKIHGLLSRITDKQGFYSTNATKKLIKFIEEYKPDVINLHNIHGYFLNVKLLFEYLKKSNIKVVWTLHDCWAFTGHCAYFDYVNCSKWQTNCTNCLNKKQYPKSLVFDNSKNNFSKKKEIFTGIKNLTIVTPSIWLKDLVKQSFLKEYNTVVINNGIDLSLFKPAESDFKKRNGFENKKIILASASVWEERKGLKFVKELANRLPNDKYQVVVCGANYEQVKDNKNIFLVKHTNSITELAEIYSSADVFINPTLEDNFPSSNIEALACGTPVITFKTGGSGESIGNCGLVLEEKTIDALESGVLALLNNLPTKEQCLDKAQDYSEDNKFGEYYRLFTEV